MYNVHPYFPLKILSKSAHYMWENIVIHHVNMYLSVYYEPELYSFQPQLSYSVPCLTPYFLLRTL